MNWTNWRKLHSYLTALPDERFDYAQPRLVDGCGCVGAHILANWIRASRADEAIELFLGVSYDEARFIWGDHMTPIEPRGRFGKTKREALRRLDVVAQRYGGEPAPSQPAIRTPEQFARDLVRSMREPVSAREE